MSDQIAIDAIQQQSEMETRRSGFDNYLDDIREYVRPATQEFYGIGTVQQPKTNIKAYDSTALWSAQQLASGYAGFLTPANDRWADIIFDDDLPVSHEEQLWLDQVADLLYRHWGNPASRFIASMQEDYLDLAAFGTSTLYQEYNPRLRTLRFRSYPTAAVWLAESAHGVIDVIHRSTVMTTRQLYQMFDESKLNVIDQIMKDRPHNRRTWEVLHIVRPASDMTKPITKVKKRYESLYVLKCTKDTLSIGGYDYFPYHIGRESVVAGQVYGQSNAFTMLPAIKMLNAMMRTVIKGANKAVDPPIMVPSDGFLVPLRSDPGALLWYDPSAMSPDSIITLDFRGRVDISDQLIQDVREQIVRGFHVDWLIRNKKNERQTATEIMDDRDEMLRQLSPTLGRLESDKISPIVATSYYILNQHGHIPPAPTTTRGRKLGIRYQSPAARAQFGARGADVMRYINELTPIINLMPSVVDTLNPDELSKYLAKIRNVPAIVMNDQETIDAMREEKMRQQQQQQLIEAAPAVSKSVKDMAQAQEISGEAIL